MRQHNGMIGAVMAAVGLVFGSGSGQARAMVWDMTTVENGWAFCVNTSEVVLPSGYPAVAYWDCVDDDIEFAWM